ncbi:hypothetical protein HY994_02950 [Candidatus Micrarchaeota archaeon]|nr:hypothetical protein [Candidatus Micrarchaeota archaeon]
MLVDFTLWTYLFLLAAGILSTLVALLKPSMDSLKKAAALGLFLAVFDFVFENAGAAAGLWYSQGAPIYLMAVPIQVFFIALFAGSAFHLVLPARKDALYMLSTSLLIAVIGTGIEAMLLDASLLHYIGGWTSTNALLSYWATFLLMHIANLKMHGHRVLHEDGETNGSKARTSSTSGVSGKKKRR